MRSALATIVLAGCAAHADKMAWPTAPGPAGSVSAGRGTTVSAGRNPAVGGGLSDKLRTNDELDSNDDALAGEADDRASAPTGSAPTYDTPSGSAALWLAEQTAINFQWPLASTGINSLFGERLDPIDGKRHFHGGVDLEAHYGALVTASAPGIVIHADWAHGHGRQVVIEHAGGFRTVYSHLAQILVQPGVPVRAGDVIGQAGNSGRSTGAHLHFEVSRWGDPLDPLDVLGQTLTLR